MSHSNKNVGQWTTNDFMSFISSIGIKGTNYDKIRKTMDDDGLSVSDIRGTAADLKESFGISMILAKKIKKQLDGLRITQKVNNSIHTSSTPSSANHSLNSGAPFVVNLRGKQGRMVTLNALFTKDSTVEDVALKYKDQECVKQSYKVEKIVLESKRKVLLHDKTLGYYGITNEYNLITVIFKTKGGAQAMENDDRCIKFGKFGLNKTSLPDVLIGYDDDDGIDRALLDCGKHAMTADTMFMYITTSLSANLRQTDILCPGNRCGKVLDWQKCTQIADMNRYEYMKWTDVIEKRAMVDCKQCPHCKAYCKRDDGVAIFRMRCIACSGSDWCWECCKPWRGSGLSMCCNQECLIIKDTNDKLAHCETVKVAHTNVEMPRFRACPRCLTFIEYTKACKHMICSGCDKRFCFVCLGLQDSDGNYPCGSHTTVCKMAQRQQFK